MDDLRRRVALTVTITTTLSMLVIAAGVVLGLLGGQGLALPGDEEPFADIGRLSPGGIVLLGIMLLALTPLAHIAAASTAFARGGERRYLWTSVAVGSALVGSLVVAVVAGS